jgi:phosphate transport system permease protein
MRQIGFPLPQSRLSLDRLARKFALALTIMPLLLVILIFIALLLRTLPILRVKSIFELLTGQVWQPFQGQFGFYPFIMGTVWVTLVAMIISIPVCLLSAIYLSEYASLAARSFIKPLLDLLAGIPSVVYGVWGVLTIVPWVKNMLAPLLNKWLGFIPLFALNNPTGFSVFSGGFVLAVMIAPFIIAVTYEIMSSIPSGLREASLALGATRWQTIKHVLLPKAASGIFAGIVLGASRALGETMAVLMVVGNVPKSPTSLFDAAYPLTALIANNYGEMLSIPLYDAALLGSMLILLGVVIFFNVFSALVLRHVTEGWAK